MEQHSGHILVVDDDPDLNATICLVLQMSGFETRSASNGREALESVEKYRPNLVVLDMLMPVMDGWEFARELRNRHGFEVPVIVVTAAEHAKVRADQVKAEGFLSKPFIIDDLVGLAQRLSGVEPKGTSQSG